MVMVSMFWNGLLFFLHLETLFFIGIVIAVVYFFFISPSKKNPLKRLESFAEEILGAAGKLPVAGDLIKKPKRKKNKHEERCREIFQDIFNVRFKSCRPDWLENPVTNRNLELDGFNAEIRTPKGKGLAFEYDGVQHSQFTSHFQSNEDEFIYQTKKDSWKDLRCQQEGVMLIRIPSFVGFQDLERYIKQQLRKVELGRYVDRSSVGMYDSA